MPTHRKRIGFLPSKEVQDIIDELCIEYKYSQSKITGLLVEEALISRGILKNNFLIPKNNFSRKKNLKMSNKLPNNLDLTDNEYFPEVNDKEIKEEIEMINEFIEFKFFKKIMLRNNKY